MSAGRKPTDKKYLAKLDPFMSFKVPHPHFSEPSLPKSMGKTSMSAIGVEDQSVPNQTRRGGIQQHVTGRVAKVIRRANDKDDNDWKTSSLIHDHKKGIKGTLSGDHPAEFRTRQYNRMRGFNQAKTATETGDLYLIKHNPVKWDHDPFYQKFTPREKV